MVLTLISQNLYGTWGHLRKSGAIKKPLLDPSDWESVGSYGAVVLTAPYDADAAEILHAWLHGIPLPPRLNIRSIDRQFDDLPPESDPDPPPKQTLLWG